MGRGICFLRDKLKEKLSRTKGLNFRFVIVMTVSEDSEEEVEPSRIQNDLESRKLENIEKADCYEDILSNYGVETIRERLGVTFVLRC